MYKSTTAECGYQKQEFLWSCPAATTKLLLSIKIFVRKEISSSSATKEEEIKRNCTVNLHEPVQTSMKLAASGERTKESSDSTGQNNVQINIHGEL